MDSGYITCILDLTCFQCSTSPRLRPSRPPSLIWDGTVENRAVSDVIRLPQRETRGEMKPGYTQFNSIQAGPSAL